MIVKTFIEPPIDNNNYLIIDEESKEAALIDCSAVDEKIRLELKKQGATLKYILLTHGHFDHIAGIRQGVTPPPTPSLSENAQRFAFSSAESQGAGEPCVLMHKNDQEWVNNVNRYLPMMGLPEMTVPKVDKYIEDNEIIKLGNSEIKVIHTPGHTQGGVCFYVDGKLFSGDTIFREAVGRCDLEGGNFDQIVESIESKIFTLPPETVIYPGHGRMTSIEWEKEHNRFL